MRLRNTCGFWCLALLAIVEVPALAGAEATHEGSGAPQLEIRQYRFSRHNRSFDRLVLEFARKDNNPADHPKIHADRAGNGEWNIAVDNAQLLGAIPESLINDSFAGKSRFLKDISVNMDSTRGFSVHANLKTGRGTQIEALWLENPARLVIDTYGAGHQKPEKQVRETSSSLTDSIAENPEALSIERKAKIPTFEQLVCFPATARVGLMVVFHPDETKTETVQNFRVYTDGIGGEVTPAADAINCYPKKSQIKAALSFEEINSGAAWERPKDKLVSPLVPTPFRASLSPLSPMPLPPMRTTSSSTPPSSSTTSPVTPLIPMTPMAPPVAAASPPAAPSPSTPPPTALPIPMLPPSLLPMTTSKPKVSPLPAPSGTSTTPASTGTASPSAPALSSPPKTSGLQVPSTAMPSGDKTAAFPGKSNAEPSDLDLDHGGPVEKPRAPSSASPTPPLLGGGGALPPGFLKK